jgi:hypothetical protein
MWRDFPAKVNQLAHLSSDHSLQAFVLSALEQKGEGNNYVMLEQKLKIILSLLKFQISFAQRSED